MALCSANMGAGVTSNGIPEALRALIPKIGRGLFDHCNIHFTAPTDYVGTLKKLAGILHVLKPMIKGVVVGGYSQGGTLAADLALAYT